MQKICQRPGRLKNAGVLSSLVFAGLTLPPLFAQTASLTVVVLDATTQAPIAGVELKLGNRSAHTGVDGKARFDKLSPGMVFVDALHDGYMDSKVTGSGHAAQIKKGDTDEELTIRLTRSTSLEGRVFDEEGRPVRGVFVQTSSGETVTDSEGRFRQNHMYAGPSRLDFRIPADLRRKTLERDPKTGAIMGYPAAEFYPGVTDPQMATKITVAPGMDLHGLDVRLKRMLLTDFTGQTMAHAGEPLAGVHVELTTAGSTPMVDETLGTRQVDADGRFRFELIPPGSYVLLVYKGENGGGQPYVVPVAVGNDGLRDKQILVPPFQTLRGMLRVKDGAEWSGEVRVTVKSDQKGVTDRDAIIRSSGEFAIDDVPPGQWQLIIQTSISTMRLSDKHQIRVTNAHFGGTNPTTSPILVVESGNPLLEIELSGETGRIAGRVVSGHTNTILVLLVGAPLARFNLQDVTLRPDGTFVSGELMPGLYDVRAIPGAPGKPVRVEVKSGETATVEVAGGQ